MTRSLTVLCLTFVVAALTAVLRFFEPVACWLVRTTRARLAAAGAGMSCINTSTGASGGGAEEDDALDEDEPAEDEAEEDEDVKKDAADE